MTPDPEESRTDRGPRSPLAMMVGVVLGLAGIIGLWMLLSGAFLIRPTPRPAPTVVPGESAAPPGDLASCRRLAAEVWQAFIEAPDLRERLEFVKDPERVAPLIEDFHVRRGHAWPTMGRILPDQSMTSADFHHLLFVVEPYEGAPYAVPMEWSEGSYRVDWEVLTAYGSMDWYELIESRPRETQRMRVFVSPMNELWKLPSLPAGTATYVMEHRSAADAMTVAARHAVVTELADAVTAPRTPMRVEVKWSEDLDCLEIVRVIGRNWNE